MPLYTNVPETTSITRGRSTPSTGEYVGAMFEQSLVDSPGASVLRLTELDTANQAPHAAGMYFNFPELDTREPEYLSNEEQQKSIDSAGLTKHLKPQANVTREGLKIIEERKLAELDRLEVLSHDIGGGAQVAGFAAALGAQFLDPINIASSFIPTIGQARAFNMLGHAAKRGKMAMATTRAKMGALDGAVGAALVEPLTYLAHRQEQADYDMYDSLLNVSFGAIMGATLQPAFGAVGDVLRARRGERAPWEIVSPTLKSQELLEAHTQDAFKHRMSTGIDLDEAQAMEQVKAGAILFDANARTLAYDMGKTPEDSEKILGEIYERFRPKYGDGEAQGAIAGFEPVDRGMAWDGQRRVLNQPINEGVDLDKEVPIIQAQFEKQEVWQSNKGQGRKDIIQSIIGTLHNEITGDTIELNSKNAAHLVNSATNKGIGGKAHIAAVRNIKELMRVAELIETHKDFKNQADVEFMHRYYAPMLYDGEVYTVKLSVKQYDGARRIELDEVKKLYDAKLEKKELLSSSDRLTVSQGVHIGNSSSLKVRQLIEGVKDSKGTKFDEFFQAGSQDSNVNARASAYFDPQHEQAVINFFQNTDATSMPHEMFHVFRRMLQTLVEDERASVSMKERYQAIEDFVEAEQGKPWTKEQEEKFAMAGERYLFEGKSPNAELEGVFSKMKQWFREIYTDLAIQKIPISKEMRKVFGEMLTPSFEEADILYRAQFGNLLSYDDFMARADEYKRGDEPNFEMDGEPGTALNAVNEQLTAADESFAHSTDLLAQNNPKIAEEIRALAVKEMAEVDAELAKLPTKKALYEEVVRCEFQRG